jgi:hypothetical protein
MNWFEAEGRVIYDPHRGTMKSNTNWWCVIDVDKEITRYYRWWLLKEKHLILNQPAWDAHISVVRGERRVQQNQNLWKKHHGRKVKFKYEHGDIQVSKDKDAPGWFHWIRVDCPVVDEIREELGLIASWKYHHLTIGRTYY